MSVERRDQQKMTLKTNTHQAYNSQDGGQKKLVPSPSDERYLNWNLRIGLRAQDKAALFSNLMKHFNKEVFHEAYQALKGKRALGVDKVSKAQYGKKLEQNLEDLVKRVQSGRYRPLPKREVLIPKANGKTRPIAIASFEDKLVDWVAGEILSQIYEPLFIKNSFGYRPNKSADGAIKACYYSMEKNKRPNVVEIDFSNFFNTIPHRKMMKILERRIPDKRFLGLIMRLLSGEIRKSTGETLPSEIGTPQGGIASPILANIYLNEVVDQWFIENYASYNNIIVRYADDAVFFFRKEDEAKDFIDALNERVKMYGLVLNRDKTHQLKLDKDSKEHFHFLGFTFYWGKQGKKKMFKLKTQKTKLHKGLKEFDHWIKDNRNRKKLSVLWELAEAKIRGHVNYYGYGMNNTKVHHFYSAAINSLFKWLNRRSQKRSYDWEGFQERIRNFPLLPAQDQIKWKQLGRYACQP